MRIILTGIHLLLLFLFTTLQGQSDKPHAIHQMHCGQINKVPIHQTSQYPQTIQDRFGNHYTVEELESTETPENQCSSASHFLLDFVGPFTASERSTLCSVFADLSNEIQSQHSGIIIRVIKTRLPGGVYGAGTAHYLEDSYGQNCGIGNNMIWELINTAVNYEGAIPPNTAAATLLINSHLNSDLFWHCLDDDNPTPNNLPSNAIDLYTVGLHEALHILGIASRIDNPEPSSAQLFSRWDRLLYVRDENPLDNLPFNSFLLSPADSPHCCNAMELQANLVNPIIAAAGEDDCQSTDLMSSVHAGHENAPTVFAPYSNAYANNSEYLRNRMSHLDKNCDGVEYVMHYSLSSSEKRRNMSGAEWEILCQLGYQREGQNEECSSCSIVAIDDLFFSNNLYTFVSTASILDNDALPIGFNPQTDFQIDTDCGDAALLEINSFGTNWMINGLFPGQRYAICYTINGCDGQCDQGIFFVERAPEYQPLPDCTADVCAGESLFCYGDFESFEPGLHYSYHSQLQLENCHLFDPGSINSPDILEEASGNRFAQIVNAGSNIEVLTIPLQTEIPPGCKLRFSFDYKRYTGGAAGALWLFATANTPCQTEGQPLTSPEEQNDFIRLFDVPFQVNNYNWQHSGILEWTNNTETPIAYLNFLNMPGNPNTSKVHLDNLSVSMLCENELNIDAAVVSNCWNGAVAIDYTFCLTGSSQAPTSLALQAYLPALPGISFIDGLFTQGATIIDNFIPNGPCRNLRLELETDAVLAVGTPMTIVMKATASNSCQITRLKETELALENCCPVTDPSFQVEELACGQYLLFSEDTSAETAHFWDLGNGTVMEGPEVSAIFEESGTYTITHQIINLCDTLEAEMQIVVENCTQSFACACEEGLIIAAGNGTLLSSLNAIPANIHNTCIAIDGHLIIDQNWTISASQIRMQPGAQLTVEGGNTLNLNNLEDAGGIHGCGYRWEGIRVAPEATLIIRASVIKDAQFAIQAQGEATLSISSTRFLQNAVGLYVSPSENLQNIYFKSEFFGNSFEGNNTPLFPNSESPEILNYPRAGIDLSDAVLQIPQISPDAPPNHFSGLQNGIIAQNSQFEFQKMQFENLLGESGVAAQVSNPEGVGVFAKNCIVELDSCVFSDLGRAIHSESGDLAVFNSNISSVSTGIVIVNCNTRTIDIQNNSISFDTYGIYGYWNNHMASLLIRENTLMSQFDQTSNTGRAIYLLGNSANSSGQKIIAENILHLNSRTNGISILNDGHFEVSNNEILFDNLELSGNSTPCGVSLGLSSNNWFFSNSITATLPTSKVRAFFVASSTANTFCCNTTSKTRTGFEFFGSCSNTQLRNNSLGIHEIGLKCNLNTFIGQQIHGGNRWKGPFSEAAAQHLGNAQQVADSRFYVEPILGSEQQSLWPQTVIANIANETWFVETDGHSLGCNQDIYCQPPNLEQSDIVALRANRIEQENYSVLEQPKNLEFTSFEMIDVDAVREIMHSCPLAGSESFLKATALLTATASVDWEHSYSCYDTGLQAAKVVNRGKKPVLAHIAPNPAQYQLVLRLESNVPQDVSWQLLSPLGETVLWHHLDSATRTHQLDLPSLMPGLYFWVLKAEGVQLEQGKVFIQQ